MSLFKSFFKPFKVGDRVFTGSRPRVEPLGYSFSARRGNQWGVEGTVLEISSRPGVCYRVQHWGPESQGWYEPMELRYPVGREVSPAAVTLWDLLEQEPLEG
jgi:hypothetical protein